MRDDEATELTNRLKGLFPDLTGEQLLFWHQELLKFDRDPVARAIHRLARESDLFRRPRLFELIHHEQPQAVTPNRSADKADDDARRAFLLKVDLWIGNQEDVDLARMKKLVLEHAEADLQFMFTNRDPRSSGWLKTQIYSRFGSQQPRDAK